MPPEHISKLAERFLSLFAALGATSGFVAVRDGLELEEAPFLVALVGFCTLAAVAAATASYAVNSHMTLRFNAANLANEQYVDRIGGGHYIPGPGRQMIVTATIKR